MSAQTRHDRDHRMLTIARAWWARVPYQITTLYLLAAAAVIAFFATVS